MLSGAEIVTALGAVVTVVGVSVAATVYFAGEGSGEPVLSQAEIGPHRYVISDAYYLCRDHIGTAIPSKVRNINVDSHSSRYDENRNDNIVFIDLQVVEAASETEDAQVECRVSAANNEIKSFLVRRG